jgi:hypothetical protein
MDFRLCNFVITRQYRALHFEPAESTVRPPNGKHASQTDKAVPQVHVADPAYDNVVPQARSRIPLTSKVRPPNDNQIPRSDNREPVKFRRLPPQMSPQTPPSAHFTGVLGLTAQSPSISITETSLPPTVRTASHSSFRVRSGSASS